MSAVEPDIVERKCPDCDFVASGPASGKGSVGFKIGAHRSNVHQYRNPNGKRARTAKEKLHDGAPGDGAGSKPTVLRVVEAATSEISDRAAGAPTTNELSRTFARAFGAVSVGMASYAAETDPNCETEEDREAVVDMLSLQPEEARDLAYPLARALGRSKVNQRYGRSIVDNVDVVSALTELGLYAARWRRYFRMRDLREQQMVQQGWAPAPGGDLVFRPPAATPAPVFVPPDAPIDVHVPDGEANATGAAFRNGFAPMAGVVVTPAMVEQIKADHG